MINPISASAEILQSTGMTIAPQTTATNPFSKVSEAIASLEGNFTQNAQAISQFANGTSTMPTHELMIKMETSRLDLMLALQVRNKVIEAVQEIYRTQI